MIPPRFEYHAPQTVGEAVALLGQLGPDAKLLAGGHSLLPMMKLRFAQPEHLIDINRIPELKGIREEGNTVVIGAMTVENDLITSPILQAKVPLLCEAAKLIADPQVRNRGTIGGDIAHGDPGNDHPALSIDRADEAFEAFLLEVLADYQITVPEIGTIRATHIPQVILTSNGTRELSDALRRRCLYHYLDYPTLAREIAIVKAALPEADTRLVEDAVQFVQRLRREDLAKIPGIAETLDWVRALFKLDHHSLPEDMSAVLGTLGCLLKTREDRFAMGADRLRQLVEGRRSVGVAEKDADRAQTPS